MATKIPPVFPKFEDWKKRQNPKKSATKAPAKKAPAKKAKPKKKAVTNKKGIRVSTIESDPGFKNYQEITKDGASIEVYLDNKPLSLNRVITACEKSGTVVQAVVSQMGHWQVDPKNPTQILTETLYGKVEVKIIEPKNAKD